MKTYKKYDIISNILNNPIQSFFIFLIFAFVLIGFLPVLVANYVPQDQWRAFTYGTGVDGLKQFYACKNRVFNFYLSTGRPLVYIPECVEHAFIKNTSDFCFLRIPSLLITFANMLIGAKIFRKITNYFWQALALTLTLIFNPGYAFMFYQGYTAAGVLASIGLALASLYYLIEAYCKGNIFLNSKNKILFTITGIILFFISLLNYAAFAFVVIPVAFFIAVFSKNLSNTEKSKFLIVTYSIYVFTCLMYLIFVKFTTLHIPQEHLGNYKVSIAGLPIILGKIHKFTNELFFNSTLVNYKVSIYILLSFIIISAFFIPKTNKNIKLKQTIFAKITYVILFPIIAISSSSPVFISYFDSPLTRHTLPPLFMLGFCVIFSLIKSTETLSNKNNSYVNYNKFINVILFFTITAFTIQQFKISINLIQDSSIELFTIKNKVNNILTKDNITNGIHMHIIRPNNGSFIGKTWFGSTEYAPAITQNPEHIKQLITMILKNKYKNDDILYSIYIRDCQLDIKCGYTLPSNNEIVITQSLNNRGINFFLDRKSTNIIDLSNMHN